MASDLLDSAQPKRLVCSGGRWTLEVVRLVAIDTNLFQPRMQSLQGVDAVLGFLKRNPNGQPLLNGTQQLLKSVPGEEARSFENVDGEWIPTQISPSYIKQLGRQVRRKEQRGSSAELRNLRAEVLLLRASHQRLKERVVELERKLGKLTAGGALVTNVAAPGHVRISQAPEANVAPEKPPPSAASEPVVSATDRTVPASIDAASVARAEPAPVAAPEPAPSRQDSARRQLKIPPIRDMVGCMRILLGDEVDIKKTPLTVDYQQELDQYWISTLIDDQGEDVGAMLADLTATVHLGGVLMMLPETELKAQMKSGEPSEDAIAAMSEVCNNLSGSFNNIEGNPHVKCGYLEPHDLKARPWLKSAKTVQQLEDNFGGRMLLVMRHP